MQDVSLTSSHGTVHSNIVYSLNDLHISSVSSTSASIPISVHEIQHYTFIGSNNFSDTYSYPFNDISCCVRVNFQNNSGAIALFNDAMLYNDGSTFPCFSSSLVNSERYLLASCMLDSNDSGVFSNSNGHPSVLDEIPQHEECIVKSNSFQSSFKGVYGSDSFTVASKSASSSNIF